MSSAKKVKAKPAIWRLSVSALSELTVRRVVAENRLLIIPTSDKSWHDDVNKASYTDLVLVLFEADWCGPCKLLKAVVETVAEKHPEVHVHSYDVDTEKDQTVMFHIDGIPTMMLFKAGCRAETLTGYQSVDVLERHLAKHLVKPA
jgi:thioredoxin 1